MRLKEHTRQICSALSNGDAEAGRRDYAGTLWWLGTWQPRRRRACGWIRTDLSARTGVFQTPAAPPRAFRDLLGNRFRGLSALLGRQLLMLHADDGLAAEAAVAELFEHLPRGVQLHRGADARTDRAVREHPRHLLQPWR